MTASITPPHEKKELLQLHNLRVVFHLRKQQLLTAVDGIDLAVREGEVHGLIGESGSGKTVTALAAMGLLESPAEVAGQMAWCGRDLTNLTDQDWRKIRGRGMSMLFQDAPSSLNPALRIASQLRSVIKLHQNLAGQSATDEAIRILQAVRLSDPTRILQSYPHELSGGMAQRVALAMALACRPRLLIADEPTSALDVTIAVQIIDLLKAVRRDFGLSMLIISHDLGAVSRICDRVSVMYLGRIVETGVAEDVLSSPMHPYTAALLEAASWSRHSNKEDGLRALGEMPSALNPPTGCRFHPRCPKAFEPCHRAEPGLIPRDSQNHRSACWLGVRPADLPA